MLGPAEITRAARLAVARYGAEPGQVQDVLDAVLAAQARGEKADVLDALVEAALLSERHAGDLRSGLDQTQVDPDTYQAVTRFWTSPAPDPGVWPTRAANCGKARGEGYFM